MLKKEQIFSSLGIFIIYSAASFLAILGFRFIFPGQAAPLRNFSGSWRIVQGILNYISLFPALALSALVIPFGFQYSDRENYPRFSPRFLDRVKGPLAAAITAAVVYGLLFFLVLPLAQRREAKLLYEGNLFRLARERAGEFAESGDWPQAAQFMALCDRIWPGSPETASLKTAISIGYENYRMNLPDPTADAFSAAGGEAIGIPGQQNPVNASQALGLAEQALREERYYDAHWLANLGMRLARPGSVESSEAVRLAGYAWNAVSSLEPNSRERQTYALYHRKRSGYEAMVSGDWIRAYYIFKDLREKTPGDPDVVRFLTMCEQGVAAAAFFTDEMKLAMGDILTGAVFSLPGVSGGRWVLRTASLSTFADFSFASGLELAAYDGAGRFLYRMETPYGKFLPFTLEGESKTLLLMRALDREDERVRLEPVWTVLGEQRSPETEPLGNSQLLLDISYEDMLLHAKVLQGTDNLLIGDLFAAARNLENYGYIPQVFQAEILSRIAEPALLLSAAVFSIAAGWSFRARKRPRYIGAPMLGILPLVFTGIVYCYRSAAAVLMTYMIIALRFSTALLICTAAAVLLFIFSLITLAARHG
ncbi:MAG: hypothetical protein LBO80_09100 [Treponema sp.]|jgi:hypothetical protein|nr:hypothetical protein [Treponema sp.]